jgi:hypothetical protein
VLSATSQYCITDLLFTDPNDLSPRTGIGCGYQASSTWSPYLQTTFDNGK